MHRGLVISQTAAGRLPFQELVNASVRHQRVHEKVAFRGCTGICVLLLLLSLTGPLIGSSSKQLAAAVSRRWEQRSRGLFRTPSAAPARAASRQRGRAAQITHADVNGSATPKQPSRPQVSFVLLSFRHQDNVQALCRAYGCSPSRSPAGLRAASELIVVEDGGGEARKRWAAAAKDSGGHTKLLESDNVHEIRAYNNGFKESSGEFLVMLQDDDLPPEKPGHWLWPALRLFRLHPHLGLVSCTDGFTTAEIFEDHHGRAIPIMLEDSRAPGTPFMFVVGANSAPVLYRSAAFRAAGGFNASYSAPSQPGIGFETEISLRMWRAGWQSAIMDCGSFRRGLGGHGTLATPEKRSLRKAAWAANQERMKASFLPPERQEFAATVKGLNSRSPMRERLKTDICRDLRARMKRRKEGDGAEKVSKKSAEIVRPWFVHHRCR